MSLVSNFLTKFLSISVLMTLYGCGDSSPKGEEQMTTTGIDKWHIERYRDPVNSELVSAAVGQNSEGFSIVIFRNGDSRVRWVLSMPQKSFDRIVGFGRVASFRVDDSPSSDIEVSNVGIVEQPTVKGILVRDLLWHGEGPSPTHGTLRNLLDGAMLSIRFYIEGGSTVDTRFDLSGAPVVISRALGISEQADSATAAFEKERDEAVVNATNLCVASNDMKACIGILTSCAEDTKTLTASMLKQCMSKHGYNLE